MERGGPWTTLAIAALFVAWTGLALALCPLYLLLRVLGGASPARAAREGTCLYGRGLLLFIRPWVLTQASNPDRALHAGPCIILANHQSFLDIYLIGAQNQRNLCLLAKSWPFRLLFFFAPVMRLAGYVETESLDAAAIERLCLKRLAQGATLVCFPEGSRSRDGRLGRFHSGIFRVATKAGVPVVPMVIRGSGQVFPVGARHFKPGTVYVDLLPPVLPGDFTGQALPHRALLRQVRGLYLSALCPNARSGRESS